MTIVGRFIIYHTLKRILQPGRLDISVANSNALMNTKLVLYMPDTKINILLIQERPNEIDLTIAKAV
jgi:hypothetical protein